MPKKRKFVQLCVDSPFQCSVSPAESTQEMTPVNIGDRVKFDGEHIINTVAHAAKGLFGKVIKVDSKTNLAHVQVEPDKKFYEVARVEQVPLHKLEVVTPPATKPPAVPAPPVPPATVTPIADCNNQTEADLVAAENQRREAEVAKELELQEQLKQQQ